MRDNMEMAVRVEQSTWDFYDDPWGEQGPEEYRQFQISERVLGRHLTNPRMVVDHQRTLESLGYVIH